MPPSPSPSVTALLHAAGAGDRRAFDELYDLVYEELRRLAHRVRTGRAGETLNTTALVHEAYVKLLPAQDLDWSDRAHFFRVAARAMRQVLVNAAEQRMAQKRGGGQIAVRFDERVHRPVEEEKIVELDRALRQLERMDQRQARVVECRFFAGLTVDETAQVLGVSAPTIKRDWRVARAWLAHRLA